MNINTDSMEIEDINLNDYPDLVDAHCVYVEDEDGNELNADQLDKFNEDQREVVYEKALLLASGG